MPRDGNDCGESGRSGSPEDIASPAKEVGKDAGSARPVSRLQLPEDEERLRDFFDNAIDLIQSVSPEGRFLYVNRAWRDALGFSEEEVERLTVFDVISSRCRDHCMKTFASVMSGENVGTIETTFVAKDGREIIVEGNVNCRFEAGRPVSSRSIFRNVTERKRLEEEIRKTSTLESIGILAGGIAHDFNNLLTAILGNVSLARRDLPPGSEMRGRLEEAEKASLRAQDLTRQLLTFSTGGAPIKEAASIAELIRETTEFALRGSNVRCEFRLDGDLLPVEIDTGQICQVLRNIVINAGQAMPDGGIVSVRGENVVVSGGNGVSLREGTYVRIRISDSGFGIPEEILPRVFDPFFTTKEKGTGLGLATCHSIVKRHDGLITVESEVGKGTTFIVYLPSARERVRTTPPRTEDIGRGKGKVLVMDDEEMLRTVALDMLRTMGFRGVAVADGAAAVSAYLEAKDAGAPFDAVIMDLTVPGGMGGKEAVRRLLEAAPEARVIVSSGYCNDAVMSDFRRFGFRGVIAKPYRIGDLARALESVACAGGEALA